MTRDIRLDLIRGYAMLAIALNHLGWLLDLLGFSQRKLPTFTDFGYSSAASLFFGLSGYLIGLIYLRRPGATSAIWKRAWLIYRVNTVAFLLGLLIAFWQPAAIRSAIAYDTTVASPVIGSLLFLAMLHQPALLDVLQMYVILMILTPLVALAMRKHPAVTMMICLGVYAVSQPLIAAVAAPAAILEPNGDWRLSGVWNMNLLSWQLLFFGAMYAGTLTFHEKLFAWVGASATRRWAIVGLYVVVAVVRIGEKFGQWGTPPLVDKETLEPLRLAHFALTILMLCSVLVMLRDHLTNRVGRIVALVGRQTLYGFAASIPATYLAVGFWWASGGTYLAYLLSSAFVVVVVIVTSQLFEMRKLGPKSRVVADAHG